MAEPATEGGKVIQVPRWGTPIDPDRALREEPAEVLSAGSEERPAPPRPVDSHLIAVRRTPGERMAAIRAGEVTVPAWLTDARVARETAARAVKDVRKLALISVILGPGAVVRVAWWTIRGVVLLEGRAIRWAWDKDGHPVLGAKPAESDRAYVAMADKRTMRQKYRFGIIGAAHLAALIGWSTVLAYWPAFTWPVAAAVATVMARVGRPQAATILSPSVRGHVTPRLTAQGIVRALAALGISALTKALDGDSTGLWRSDILATRGGHKVHIQMPGTVLAADLVQHEQRLAMALQRPEDCVIVEPMPHVTPGDLMLYVFDRPQLTGDLGPGPLAAAKKTSWWEPVQIGITRLGQPHREALRGGAWFLGGRPSSGKSSLARVAACHTALDVRALLLVANLKGSPDYVALQPICHRYVNGAPETDPTVIERTMVMLQWLLDECGRRNDFLTKLAAAGKAESNDVTPELAAKYERLRPITAILDEVHRLIDKTDNPRAEEAAELLGKVIKAVRSAGITLICITQLAGTESIPPALTRAARVRGCLVVGDEVSFRHIFGNSGPGAFARAGVNRFRPGTVLLAALDGSPVKVGVHNITPAVMRTIGQRALGLRTDSRTLTGEAAGEAGPEPVDPAVLLRAVLDALPSAAPARGASDRDVAWLSDLEEVLGQADSQWSDRADGWLSGELRARGVDNEKVNRRWVDGGGKQRQRTAVGVRADSVRQALARLAPGESLAASASGPLACGPE